MKNAFSLLFITILFFGCSKSEDPKPETVFHRIVILGNSITYAPGTEGTEWNVSRGMAASAPEFDYVHLITKNFKNKDGAATVTAKNIAAFERTYDDYNIDSNLHDLRDTKPDLLILRIGENVKIDETNKVGFQKRYKDLLDYFKSNNPDVVILGVGSIWGNELSF